ncbi:hypothetical protein HanRHA438_Chr09g0383321 [Helianthus annuus]|nr:hypothetical protein HanRHA438_Chr09g0383321 [Helianthus annuus]
MAAVVAAVDSGQQSSLVSLGSDYSFESTPGQTRSELVKDGQRQIISGSSQLINSVIFSFSLLRSTASVRLRFAVRRFGSVDSVKLSRPVKTWSTVSWLGLLSPCFDDSARVVVMV